MGSTPVAIRSKSATLSESCWSSCFSSSWRAAFSASEVLALSRRLVTENGVAAIPVSAFYAEGAVRNVVRFCFAKRDATLDAALERLAARRPR